jgi:hypothetical protein
MTLTEFLLARLTEDEEAARIAGEQPWVYGTSTFGFWVRVDDAGSVINVDGGIGMRGVGRHMMRWQPARVLAECDSKRRIVERCREALAETWDDDNVPEFADAALRLLALPFAPHVDYRDEWRP